MPGQENEHDSRRYMVVHTDDLATLDEAIDQLKEARSGSDNAYEVAEVWVLSTANPEELRPLVETVNRLDRGHVWQGVGQILGEKDPVQAGRNLLASRWEPLTTRNTVERLIAEVERLRGAK